MQPTTDFDIAPLVRAAIEQVRIPRVTYRVQFHGGFTFRQAQALVGYLDMLGVSDLYASPILRPRAGSQHGYDVTDPTQLNPALGSTDDFAHLVDALQQRQMGLLLDTVPNHMGIGDESNLWWMDVLENGPSSVYAKYFDVSWQTVKPELENKVLLPVLEDQYGSVLEDGKLRLVYDDGAFWVLYHSMRLPVAPGSYHRILNYPLDEMVETLGTEDADMLEYQSILTSVGYLPERTETDPLKLAERNREKEIIKRRIATLYDSNEAIRAAIDSTLMVFNGTVGKPDSFDRLDDLIDAQAYRPAFWRVAAEEINYRRFFDINDLAAIRPEDLDVFQATHALILRLLAEGNVTGLRIDHIDGLYDPETYLWRLQEQYVLQVVRQRLPASDEPPDEEALTAQIGAQLQRWHDVQRRRDPEQSPQWPLYVVAEKILGEDELLPQAWAVYGTSGYDFLNTMNGMFVESQNARAFDTIYHDFTAQTISFGQLINETKKMIMLVSMTSEIYNLSHQLERIAERNRRYRDFTLDTITFALREVIAALPIYRTYITDDVDSVTARDQRFVEQAVAKAQRRNPRTAKSLFQFLKDTLLLRNLDHFDPEGQQELIAWVRKFQQVTGPVMAKGVEDTAFYRYNRLVALNEVGGHPDHFGNTVASFHERNRLNQRSWPHTMLTTSTHDTKRSEDVRARIDVLSELPDAWRAALAQWSTLNAPHKATFDDETAPDANDEYLLYQTLIGAWPFNPHAGAKDASRLQAPSDNSWGEFRERIIAYMQKATKEAKLHTSWVNADQEYDSALNTFIRTSMDAEQSGPFLESIMAMAAQVAFFGQFNALAQALLKLASPGVPDIYQGTEMWDLSLVDPDNRRPVDYDLRRHLLGEMLERIGAAGAQDAPAMHTLTQELLDTIHDGRIKLYLTQRALELRRAQPDLFMQGDYRALEAQGDKAEHVVAFARATEDATMLVVVPRLLAGLTGGEEQLPLGAAVWGETWLALPDDLAARRYCNWFTGDVLDVETLDGEHGVRLADVFAAFPVALLTRADA